MTQAARFDALPPYAFPRLRALLDGEKPGAAPIAMSLGEPTHPMPAVVGDILARETAGFAKYPPIEGTEDLREAMAAWLQRRYGLPAAMIDPAKAVHPLNGTREGLFMACVALCPARKAQATPLVLMPNPFYQCYAAAALAAGAEPVYVPATPETGHLPDFASLDPSVLARTGLVYLCSPANPQGAIADQAYWSSLLQLAERYDFRVLADECYSEIYRDAAPCGALEAVAATGADPERLVVFHSLSKRSNLPGLRSGFCAGGEAAIAAIRRLRAYGGAPVPLPIQAASAAVWRDEDHVAENRRLYARKYAMADDVLGNMRGYSAPAAGFFLWLDVGDGEKAALDLWRRAGVRALPGAYLSRSVNGTDPGKRFLRVALVAEETALRRGLEAIGDVLSDGGVCA